MQKPIRSTFNKIKSPAKRTHIGRSILTQTVEVVAVEEAAEAVVPACDAAGAAHSDHGHHQSGRARRADPALTGWRRSSGRQRCGEMRPGTQPGKPRTTQTRGRG